MKMHSREEPKLYIVLCALTAKFQFSYHVFNIKKSSLLEKRLDWELLASLNSDDDIVRRGMGCGAVGSKILLLGGTLRNRYEYVNIPTSDFFELDIYDPERKFKLAGRMVGPKNSPFFAEINGAFFVLNGLPGCGSHGFEVYVPEIRPGEYCTKFLELEFVPQINVYDEPSHFVFGPRIYASGIGIYHVDVPNNIKGKLNVWDFPSLIWEESKGWGSRKTLPFTGSAAFTFHYDTEHPGNGYFFSFSGGKLSVNVIQDWNFKWSSELLEVAPSFYCNACFCSLDGGNFVLIASPSLYYKWEDFPAPEAVDIYIVTFNFEVNVDYCDDVECTPRFDYKFQLLSRMQINSRTLSVGEEELFRLQAIGCFQMC